MQTLWARVAQVRGTCRCPQCLSAANGVSRRATATATRRIPKYLTSSTLWYSGIFAAAATFDAGVKKQRREQWENAIADVKQELQQQAPTAPVRVEEQRDSQQDATLAFLPFGAQDGDTDVFRDVDPNRPAPFWPANTGAALVHKHLPPESIYATAGRRAMSERSILSPKKIVSIQTAIEVLQLQLFLELNSREWSQEAAKTVPDVFAQNILRGRDQLLHQLEVKQMTGKAVSLAEPSLSDYVPPEDDVEICHFTQDRESRPALQDLNQSLRELFDLQADEKLSKPALLAKVAYNLSICSAPPNLKTFNTLLLGFSRMKDHALTDNLITAIKKSHMRPNEVTLAAVLRHYIKTDQATNFVTWIGYMRGKNGGLALARSDVRINEDSKKRLIPKEGRPDKILQLPYATPYVFSAVIEGVVKFAGFEAALSICQNMGSEGWGLCMSGLTPLLQDCAERGDWDSGLAIWSRIQALKLSSQRREGARLMTERIKLHTFAAMLRLCSRCEKKEVFNNVWEQTIRVHQNAVEELARMVKAGKKRPEAVATAGRGSDGESDDTVRTASIGEATERSPDVGDHMEISLPEDDSDGALIEAKAKSSANDAPHLERYQPFDSLESHSVRTQQSSRSYSTRSDDMRANRSVRRESSLDNLQLDENQLYGLLPPGDELDGYELGERPMAIHG